MKDKEYKEFLYIEKEDYDKKVKINEDDVKVYSKKKLKDLYPERDYVILGETYEKKKRDKKNDIGRIELNEKRLNVVADGEHSRLFRKQSAFVEVAGGGYIALLKLRILPIILIFCILLGAVAGGAYAFLGDKNTNGNGNVDPHIKPADIDIVTVSGAITDKDGNPVSDATVSLRKGENEIAVTTTDKDGKYLISEVEDGVYTAVITYGNYVITKIITVGGMPVKFDITYPTVNPDDKESAVKAIIRITDNGTPPVAVGGLDSEAMLYYQEGKEVDITFIASKLDEASVPEDDKKAITELSGELTLTYYDFSVLKEIYRNRVLESSEYIKKTENVFEVAVPYDSSRSVGDYVFRCHEGSAVRFTELADRPNGDYTDGTYYVTADTVYIYTNCFSTYAIGSATVEHVVKGSDTITYSDKATINLKSGSISMLYQHGSDSTNDAKIELYLVGETDKLLVAESGIIPVGYQLEEMALIKGIANMPSVGTYSGLMRISYIGTDGNVTTNVEIPLSIAITQ